MVLSNGLLNLAEQKDITHAVIEKRIKNRNLDLPSEFMDQVGSARLKSTPFIVRHIYHEFFLNYDMVELKRYT